MNSHEIAAWLNSLPKTRSTPITLTVDGKEYPAAHYFQDRTAPEGCRNPGDYTAEAIYVVGPLPKCYKKRNKTCFTVAGDSREWYIAGYYEGDVAPMQPHGANFIMSPCEGKIDEYEKYPYTRKPMSFTKLA